MDAVQDPIYTNYYLGDATWKARFVVPGRIFAFLIPSRNSDYFGGSGGYYFELFMSGREDRSYWENDGDGPWRPAGAMAILEYGHPNDPSNHDAAINFSIALTPTPEPATLLLLATGIGALGGAAARRRRAVQRDHTSS